jgi:hypothetical protein
MQVGEVSAEVGHHGAVVALCVGVDLRQAEDVEYSVDQDLVHGLRTLLQLADTRDRCLGLQLGLEALAGWQLLQDAFEVERELYYLQVYLLFVH